MIQLDFQSGTNKSDSATLGGSQTRNQLGTPGGLKSFLRGAHIFYTMSNTFFQGGKIFSREGSAPPAPLLVTGLAEVTASFIVAAEIARSSKSFSEGAFLKQCTCKVCEQVCPCTTQSF